MSESTAALIELECEALKELLLAKNKDYGNNAMKRPVLLPGLTGKEGIQVRMSDKISRLEKLLLSSDKAPEVKEEGVGETMMDIAGYAILWKVADHAVKQG